MDIKDIGKKISKAGLQQRPSQMQMIEDIDTALENDRVLCIEAPTGTGKTISYCIGALTARKKQNVIISTATIALQEQLFEKDLPLLNKLMGTEAKFAIAKGRRRYVCHARLYDHQHQSDLINNAKTVEKLQQLLEKQEWFGDRDQLDFHVDSQDWNTVSTDSAGCSGKHCEFYEDCAFYKARKKMRTADFVITNHSLLLADLELGAGALLPELKDNIYIIDECHHLPEKALSHFAKSAVIMNSVDWINQLTKAVGRAVEADECDTAQQKAIADSTHRLVDALKNMHDFLSTNLKQFDDDIWLVKTIDPALLDLAKAILSTCKQVCNYCQGLCNDVEITLTESGADKEKAATLSKLSGNLNFLRGRAENLYVTWEQFCHPQQKGEAPIARWFEYKSDSFICHTSPINISKRFKSLFWDQLENGAVLCSATIRALGSFDDYKRKIGLKDRPELMETVIESTFNYDQSVLFIPNMQHEPSGSQQASHRGEVEIILPQLILPKTGTLVLFTSKSAMQQAYEAMPDDLFRDILMQGDSSKNKLIQSHKRRIQQGHRSVLFGLASFGEGLDLPADYCEHVIINKLPFAVPTTPIELTRNEWLQKNNRNPFMLSTLPATSIKLTQYVGRLIRQETDKGIITILDKRLYGKNYGHQLLENLPQFERLVNKNISELKETTLAKKLYKTHK